uniref:PID domain-containing protein n=1 Tax=Panagrellus redivivus TaxID=6233 RepID=A0A7E4UV17_PANRE
MSKTKEVYQTLKRSISATTNGLMKIGSSTPSTKDQATRWIHPPDSLIRGRVEYGVRMLGQTEVAESKGVHVVRDAIHAIRFQMQVSRSLESSADCKPKKVEIQINVESVTVVDYKSKMILHRHPLHKISFCADDKQDKRVFSYIASNDQNKHICYLFLSDKLAEQITLTIGEAFDLAFQRYIDKNSKPTAGLTPVEEASKLRERVAELESENRALQIEVEFLRKKCGIQPEPYRPSLPSTPVPKLPPPGFRGTDIMPTTNAPALVPPPPGGRRAPPSLPPRTADPISPLVGLDASIPEVGRRLENLNIEKMDNVFDDEFDPRAGEKKNSEPSNGTSSTAIGNGDHVKSLEAMIAQADSRINEISFTHATLDFGDIGDTEGLSVEDEYVMPIKSKQNPTA